MTEANIERLKSTILFKKLYEKESQSGDHEISENVVSVVREISPILERISENMPEFTLHDASHSAKIVELMGKIIPSETLDHLNIIELSILIYSAYLHDIGMTASREEREEIIKDDPEFTKLFISNEELSFKLDEAKKNEDHRTITFIEDKIFTDFLRKKHVGRSRKLIKEKYGSGETPISWKGTPYYKLIQSVCDSHGLPISELYDIKRWRRDQTVRNISVNVQYISVILRLADILDLDPERTPKCLLDFINPTDETSIKEWKKHLSIVGCKISPKEIRIEAECEHPIYQRALLEFIDMIETERKESIFLTSHYKDDLGKIYRLDLTEPIIKNYIQSNGEYIYSDFHFKLDFHRVVDLLMGERLYGDPSLTLRELLQNSVDAVRYRQSMEKKEGNLFLPFIKITLKADELIIEDNGVGMDEHIFEDYFLQIGRSYYSSSEYRINGIEIDSVSEFGIGILSVFMVASNVKVESRRKPLDPLHPTDPINIEIPTAYDYFVQRPSLRSDIGTKITLSLKSNHPFSSSSIRKKISEIAPFVEYPIVIETSEKIETYTPLLPGEIKNEKGNFKEYFEVHFDEKEGIEGKIMIVNYRSFRIPSGSRIFAQKGFTIPYQKLLPGRLEGFIAASLNLSGKSKLSLSPSRSEVVEDEKYTKLIEIIQKRILDGFEKYLSTHMESIPQNEYLKIVNELLENQIFSINYSQNNNGFYHKDEEVNSILEKIFINYIPSLMITDEGQRIYKTFRNMNTTRFAIVDFNDWPGLIPDVTIIKEAKRLVGAETVLLMHETEGKWERFKFFKKVFGSNSEIYITSIPGIVIRAFNTSKFHENRFKISYKQFSNKISSERTEKLPLFIVAPEYFEPDVEIIYNAQHPLFARLINDRKPINEASSKAIAILTDKIEFCFSDLRYQAFSPLFRWNHELKDSVNANYMFIGILKHYPEIIKGFTEVIEEYWEEAKNLGVISPEEDFIDFSVDDLPWFWNCEISD